MIPSAMPAVTIDFKVLAELHTYALESAKDISKLNYVETQQVLTLVGLIKYFESVGLEAPIELDPSLFPEPDVKSV